MGTYSLWGEYFSFTLNLFFFLKRNKIYVDL